MAILEQFTDNFTGAIEHLKNDISVLRTGRAAPALVEDIPVLAYGTRQPIKAVATITVSDAKTLVVAPWDKSLMQAVEVAISQSDLGINPVNDGTVIRVPLPDLTTERRQELIKLLNKKLEEARIAIRQVREDVRNEIEKQLDEKSISEDERFTIQDNLEKTVKEYNEQIRAIGEAKEAEITKI